VSERLSPAEAYLAQLFDQLAGTGAAGRRLLVEAEDHLRCAIADLEATGMARPQAEAAAVAGMGPARQVAGELASTTGTTWRTLLAQFVGAAWWFGAIGLLTIGLSGLLAFAPAVAWGKGAIAPDAPTEHLGAARCAYLLEYYPQPNGACHAASIAHHYGEVITYRLAAGVVGAVALGAWMVVGRGRLRPLQRLRPLTSTPPPIVMAAVGVTTFGLASIWLVGLGVDGLVVHQPWGAWAWIVSGLAAIPVFAWSSARLIGDLRRSPTPNGVAHAG
jgi:hypothetical protein